MTPETLLEVLDASHLTHYVNAPFKGRNGVMLVAPPGSFKSTLVSNVFEYYQDALVLSDLNVQQLVLLRNDLATNRYRTLAFTEFEKLYQRNPQTATNIEGHLKAMVEEGFRAASFEDQRMCNLKSQVMIVGAMTYSCYSKHFQEWYENGFARRFIWSVMRVQNLDKLEEAISKWKLLTFGVVGRKFPGEGVIEYDITEAENTQLKRMCKHQPGYYSQLTFAKKVFMVLKWKYKAAKAMHIMTEFEPTLSRDGGQLTL